MLAYNDKAYFLLRTMTLCTTAKYLKNIFKSILKNTSRPNKKKTKNNQKLF